MSGDALAHLLNVRSLLDSWGRNPSSRDGVVVALTHSLGKFIPANATDEQKKEFISILTDRYLTAVEAEAEATAGTAANAAGEVEEEKHEGNNNPDSSSYSYSTKTTQSPLGGAEIEGLSIGGSQTSSSVSGKSN